MGRAYIKPNKDEDFYVVWSSVTDAPVYWGTRIQLRKWERSGHIRSERDLVDQRFYRNIYRADRTSCSDRIGSWSWEADEEIIYLNRWSIKRSKLKELCILLGKGKKRTGKKVLALMEPEEED